VVTRHTMGSRDLAGKAKNAVTNVAAAALELSPLSSTPEPEPSDGGGEGGGAGSLCGAVDAPPATETTTLLQHPRVFIAGAATPGRTVPHIDERFKFDLSLPPTAGAEPKWLYGLAQAPGEEEVPITMQWNQGFGGGFIDFPAFPVVMYGGTTLTKGGAHVVPPGCARDCGPHLRPETIWSVCPEAPPGTEWGCPGCEESCWLHEPEHFNPCKTCHPIDDGQVWKKGIPKALSGGEKFSKDAKGIYCYTPALFDDCGCGFKGTTPCFDGAPCIYHWDVYMNTCYLCADFVDCGQTPQGKGIDLSWVHGASGAISESCECYTMDPPPMCGPIICSKTGYDAKKNENGEAIYCGCCYTWNLTEALHRSVLATADEGCVFSCAPSACLGAGQRAVGALSRLQGPIGTLVRTVECLVKPITTVACNPSVACTPMWWLTEFHTVGSKVAKGLCDHGPCYFSPCFTSSWCMCPLGIWCSKLFGCECTPSGQCYCNNCVLPCCALPMPGKCPCVTCPKVTCKLPLLGCAPCCLGGSCCKKLCLPCCCRIPFCAMGVRECSVVCCGQHLPYCGHLCRCYICPKVCSNMSAGTNDNGWHSPYADGTNYMYKKHDDYVPNKMYKVVTESAPVFEMER
jgi:hypothetical protein